MNKTIANIILKKLNIEYPKIMDVIFFDLKTPYEILVFTILSAQTTDLIVSKVIPKLFLLYPTIYSLSKAKKENLEKIIYSCGFYHKKSNVLIETSKLICKNFKFVVPNSMEELLKLPGIGRKTANIVLTYGFSIIEGIAVDTHVKRLSIRLNLSTSKNINKIEYDLMSIYDRYFWKNINILFIAHGRKICHSKNPKCSFCIINIFCFYFKKSTQ